MSSTRLVMCSRYGEELAGLEKPPMKGEIGQLIFERVSKRAWEEWRYDLQMKVLNEYRLNMGDKKDYQVMIDQMLIYLNLKSDGEVVEVENEARGRSNG